MKRLVPRKCLDLALAGTLLALAACSGDINPVRDVAVSTGIGAQQAPAPDFVEKSRSESIDYQPVGVAPPARTRSAKTADEVKAAEAEMERVRAANESRARSARRLGASPAPSPGTGAGTP
jgi:hypothetical protein